MRLRAAQRPAFVLVLSVTCALACRSKSDPKSDQAKHGPVEEGGHERDDHQKNETAGALVTPRTISLSPALIEQGLIRLSEVQAAAWLSGEVFYGEVVSAPNGVAEVGTMVAGNVISLDAVEGSRVKKGAVLAWVNAKEVGLARAQLKQARARLALSERRRERQEKLAVQVATSQSAVQEAEAEYDVARAEMDAARVTLRALGADAEGSDGRFALRAPLTGVVTERRVVLGGAVSPQETLFVVSAIDDWMIEARVPETSGSLPTPGTAFVVNARGARGQGKRCEATVENTLSRVDRRTRSSVVRLRPVSPCPGFLPGAFVEIARKEQDRLEGDATLSVEVPVLALTHVRDQPTVFVAGETPGKFRVQVVHVVSTNASTAVVRGGIRPGERVVVEGVVSLKGEVLKDVLGGH